MNLSHSERFLDEPRILHFTVASQRIDPDAAQAAKRAEEKPDPQPTPSQRKHQNDLVRKLNNAGQGRASRKG